MDLEELSTSLNIGSKALSYLKKERFFEFEKLTEFSDENRKRLESILTLEKNGFTPEDIKRYLELSKNKKVKNSVLYSSVLQALLR
ncbi:hypothetical protein JZO77_15460 [Enterococcus hulanensis]|uniref:hypothetical protein n=1 Tax=Enterococcus hulanensis TaxID=2559929 RepID=UPI001A90C39A|nr:hypothetical protein [Enterococcus hulanensis]MBO0458133.1 hypothetical protein [Enterococcus hulanensis]